MVDLSVRIGDLTLQNPVTPASGSFSWEFNDVIDLNRLGALVAKTICREFRWGNPTPRMAETEASDPKTSKPAAVSHASKFRRSSSCAETMAAAGFPPARNAPAKMGTTASDLEKLAEGMARANANAASARTRRLPLSRHITNGLRSPP